GRALLAQCLHVPGSRATQVRLIHESFNTASLNLYFSEGFRIVAPVLELTLDPEAPVPVRAGLPSVTIRAAAAADQQRMVARDARTFGTSRPQDIERYLRSARAVVAERGTTLAGFALGGFGTFGSSAGDDPELVLAMLAALAADPTLRTSALRAMVL